MKSNFIKRKKSRSYHQHDEWKLTADDLWFRMGGGKNGPYRYDGKLLDLFDIDSQQIT